METKELKINVPIHIYRMVEDAGRDKLIELLEDEYKVYSETRSNLKSAREKMKGATKLL